jgi:hypothetical protein
MLIAAERRLYRHYSPPLWPRALSPSFTRYRYSPHCTMTDSTLPLCIGLALDAGRVSLQPAQPRLAAIRRCRAARHKQELNILAALPRANFADQLQDIVTLEPNKPSHSMSFARLSHTEFRRDSIAGFT